ncbi:hypothetical protein VTI28DRAFT_7355 [Corynascus sepedonium]
MDTNPALPFTRAAQAYLDSLPSNDKKRRTEVVAASLTSIDQVIQLAGTHHITISPLLLAELASTPAAGWDGAAGIGKALQAIQTTTTAMTTATATATATATLLEDKVRNGLEEAVRDEALWRLAFTRAEGGRCEAKLAQALSIFADVQEQLEEMVRNVEAKEWAKNV